MNLERALTARAADPDIDINSADSYNEGINLLIHINFFGECSGFSGI